MEIQFPINASRALMCYPHPNLDVARNVALDRYRQAPPHLKTDWLVLLTAGDQVRWDMVPAALLRNAPVARVGASYIYHRDVLDGTRAPWFVNGEWTGPDAVVYDDLKEFGQPLRAESLQAQDQTSADQMIVICVPSLGKTSLLWVAHAIQLACPMASSRSLAVMVGYEVGEARQRLTDMVLGMQPMPKYMFFYGDDMIPPPNGLNLLCDTAHRMDEPAVCGLYYIKATPPDTPILWRNDQLGPLLPGRDFELGDAVRCDGTGLDFCLMRTEALAKLPPVKFKTLMEWIPGRGMRLETEDSYCFHRWIEAHGRGPIVDTRCRVAHFNQRTGTLY
mgnify:CR=1 FL=1